jgi:hypothetical protein
LATATSTTRTTRRRVAPKRIVRTAKRRIRAAAPSAPAYRQARYWGIASLIAIGTLVALGTAALAAAAIDPRADELLRRSLKDARDAANDLPSHLPSVHLPANLPTLRSLESLAGQIADIGQRLAGQVRAAAQRAF